MMQFPAFDFMVKPDQLIGEVNILISFILHDQKMAYEALPFVLTINILLFLLTVSMMTVLHVLEIPGANTENHKENVYKLSQFLMAF